MSQRSKMLLVGIVLVLAVCGTLVYILPPPAVPVPPKPPDQLVSPPVTPSIEIEDASLRETKSERARPTPPMDPGATADSPDRLAERVDRPEDNGPPPVTEPAASTPVWDWRAIATRSGVSGKLFYVEFNERSGLGSSATPGCFLTVGQGSRFEVITYKPDHDVFPSVPLGRALARPPLPEVLVDPYAVMKAIEERFDGSSILIVTLEMRDVVGPEGNEHTMKKTYALYEIEIDPSGDGGGSRLLYFDAQTGKDVTDDVMKW